MNRTHAIDAWMEAAEDLGFTFCSPFKVVNDGRETEFDGYLKEFGSPNGMVFVLTSDFTALRSKESKAAASMQLYFSILNEEIYKQYDRAVFVEALKDWGWFPNRTMSPLTFRPARMEKEKKAAQPGATDNPDDAQRLREDH